MGTQREQDRLPKRIRKGHRHDCPGCEYIGKNLIDHLEKDHPDARERYEKARRGVWVLADDGGNDGDGGDGVREENEAKGDGEAKGDEDGAVKALREKLHEKEKRIAKLEAYLKEKESRIEDLRETRDKLADISEETLKRLPEEDEDEKQPQIGGDGKSNGETEAASKEQAAEQIKVGLNEAFEESVEKEEGRN